MSAEWRSSRSGFRSGRWRSRTRRARSVCPRPRAFSCSVFGTFLTWLSEKDAPVFVVATANDISQLPPELMRKGRLDEIFFVDLPSEPERREIFRIHLARRGRDPQLFDVQSLAARSENFS